jgi:hypothetical protein
LAAGFAAHVGKPVMFDELKRCLATVFALRCALYRTRYSVDQEAIIERLAWLVPNPVGDRMLGVAALSMKLEQQGKEDLARLLLDAHRGALDAASDGAGRLARLATPWGAVHLVELCRRLQDALPAGPGAFEPAAVMARAELDRVIFTRREQVLASV